MGKFDLLGGQSNFLRGQMPTQLTCYLPVGPNNDLIDTDISVQLKTMK